MRCMQRRRSPSAPPRRRRCAGRAPQTRHRPHAAADQRLDLLDVERNAATNWWGRCLMKPTVSASTAARPANRGGARSDPASRTARQHARRRPWVMAIQQRGLAGVGVAHQRNHGQLGLVPSSPPLGPLALDALDAPAQDRDALAQQTAVRLQLGLARAAQADAALLPLQVGPAAHQTGREVAQLRCQPIKC